MSDLPDEEKKQVKEWLLAAFQAANGFNGSEPSEKYLFMPLSLFEEFSHAHSRKPHTSEREQEIAKFSFPDHPENMPLTVSGFLDLAATFYDRLKQANNEADIWTMLKNGGAIIQESDKVFVKTNEGSLNSAVSDTPEPYEIKKKHRLTMLISFLGNDGVNGQPIYIDDLIVIKGHVSRNMLRTVPYHIVQIPRLDMEIAVCNQVGEIAFVKKGIVGTALWDNLSKEQLKVRDDVAYVNHRNDQQWWDEISVLLSSHTDPVADKVNVFLWSKKPSKLDLNLVKDSLLAHRQATGEWLSNGKKGTDGKQGSYVLEHGPYAGQATVNILQHALVRGGRGLPGGSSIARLNAEISKEHNLDYVNYQDQEDLDLIKIKECLLAHRQATGEWLSNAMKDLEGNRGNYVLEHGPYAGQMTVSTLNAALMRGARGLPGEVSIAQLNTEISKEHDLDYVNIQDQENLDLNKIKESLFAHRHATGEWLLVGKKDSEGRVRAYILEHGPYAGQMTVGALEAALKEGLRGLAGGSSIAQLNTEVSRGHGLDYVNHINAEALNLDKIKESLLAHHQATGKWLSVNMRNEDGTPYTLQSGSYAGKISVAALNAALSKGGRGLPGGLSIAQLNAELKIELEQSQAILKPDVYI